MLKIVITNEKGGTGKSTVAALLTEYLNYKGRVVQLIDTDPLQTAQVWVNNCQQKGRAVSTTQQADYQIIDTPGSSGSAQTWIREANLVVVPLQMHYADLKVTSDWFQNLRDEIQSKIVFLPNR
jgi:cellulose biosynthesis protein BcsQ